MPTFTMNTYRIRRVDGTTEDVRADSIAWGADGLISFAEFDPANPGTDEHGRRFYRYTRLLKIADVVDVVCIYPDEHANGAVPLRSIGPNLVTVVNTSGEQVGEPIAGAPLYTEAEARSLAEHAVAQALAAIAQRTE